MQSVVYKCIMLMTSLQTLEILAEAAVNTKEILFEQRVNVINAYKIIINGLSKQALTL